MSETFDTTFSLIVSWFNAYGIIPTVIAFVIMASFYLKLRSDIESLRCRLNHLRQDFDDHPVILLFKHWEKTEGVYLFFNNMLKNSNVEKKHD